MENQCKTVEQKQGWKFILSLYFAEALPYTLINFVSVVLLKRMGIDNVRVAFWTSWLYLPWAIKMFWGPFVDTYSTKRNWVLKMQLLMSFTLIAIGISLGFTHFFIPTLFFLGLGGFISATEDISVDGFYLICLSRPDQAFFLGFRSTAFRVGMLTASGLFVYIAGKLEEITGRIPFSWSVTFMGAGVFFFCLFLYHNFVVPHVEDPECVKQNREAAKRQNPFKEIFVEYFTQRKIFAIIFFILFYRLAEPFLVRVVPLFLLDSVEAGGLGLTTAQVGLVNGTCGMLGLIIGGILGGWMIAKYGFKKCIWPMVAMMHLPNLGYIYLSWFKPVYWMAYPVIGLENFGYGFGFTLFMAYLMYNASGKHQTSHFAISTGLMAVSMMFPGMVSGYLQTAVGYKMFFILTAIFTFPGILATMLIPLDKVD
jgi:MFS transporter, PAT family, beta-lactamase induction signal transducer AmpG